MSHLFRLFLYPAWLLALALAFLAPGQTAWQWLPPLLAAVLTATLLYAELRLLRPMSGLNQRVRALVRDGCLKGDPSLADTATPDDIGRAIDLMGQRLTTSESALRSEQTLTKRAQEHARLAEERFEAAVSGAEDGLLDWDLQSGLAVLSLRLRLMLGLPGVSDGKEMRDEQGQRLDSVETWFAHIVEADRAHVRAALDAHFADGGQAVSLEHRVSSQGGAERWMQVRGRAIRSASGKPVRFVAVVSDISLRKRAEEILLGLAAGVTGARGERFFNNLVINFAKVMRVPVALITECLDDGVNRVRTVAFWDGEKFHEPMEYDLPGTPCEIVINEARICYIDAELAKLYPVEVGLESYLGVPIFSSDGRVIGHLACLDPGIMDNPLPFEPVINIFAERAAVELENKARQRAGRW